MRRHVCLFTASPDPSGVGEHMLSLAAGLRTDYTLSFGCIPNPDSEALLQRAAALGAEILPLDGRGFRNDPPIERLTRWLREHRVDLFHLHAGIGWEGHTAVYAARDAGVAAVVRTEHLPDMITDPEERASHRHLLTAVDRLICVSQGARRSMRHAGIADAKLAVVRNGVPPLICDATGDDARARLDVPPGAPLVLTVARFTEQKGHRVLLDAIPMILERHPAARFLWAGDGPLAQDLRDETGARGLAEHVRFLGHRGDVGALLAAADLFVLPSLFEGLPLSVLEAMAAGLPVVATKTCGSDEAVLDGVTGRLAPPGDAGALAAAVNEALGHPERAAAWGVAGRLRWSREFSAARMVRETAAVYEALLSHRADQFSRVSGTPRFEQRAAAWPELDNPIQQAAFGGVE